MVGKPTDCLVYDIPKSQRELMAKNPRNCLDCKLPFWAALPRQFYCEPCRNSMYHSSDVYFPIRPANKYPNNIRHYLSMRGLTIKEAALRAGLSPTVVNAWINKLCIPTDISKAEALCKVLGVDLEDVWHGPMVKKMRENQRFLPKREF